VLCAAVDGAGTAIGRPIVRGRPALGVDRAVGTGRVGKPGPNAATPSTASTGAGVAIAGRLPRGGAGLESGEEEDVVGPAVDGAGGAIAGRLPRGGAAMEAGVEVDVLCAAVDGAGTAIGRPIVRGRPALGVDRAVGTGRVGKPGPNAAAPSSAGVALVWLSSRPRGVPFGTAGLGLESGEEKEVL
jgi:hypothetical protein